MQLSYLFYLTAPSSGLRSPRTAVLQASAVERGPFTGDAPAHSPLPLPLPTRCLLKFASREIRVGFITAIK